VLTATPIMAFVAATSLETARAFYGDTLGLELASTDDYGLMFKAGGITLRVALVNTLEPASYTVLGWIVTDIHQAIAELAQHGVAMERFGFMDQDADGVWAAPGATKLAWFKDPFGNTLSLTQPA
jgi:catechol 2,3-dioxygenase-like lactoylglutathione lyase family enzyme